MTNTTINPSILAAFNLLITATGENHETRTESDCPNLHVAEPINIHLKGDTLSPAIDVEDGIFYLRDNASHMLREFPSIPDDVKAVLFNMTETFIEY